MNELLEEMSSEAEIMAFEEHVFMQEELLKNQEEHYRFDLHQQQFEHTREQISKGLEILSETKELEQKKEEFLQKRDQQIRRINSVQRKISELESVLVQVENEWKEALYQWNGNNQELTLDKELLRELSNFADSYGESSDFATVRQKVADVWIYMKTKLEAALEKTKLEEETYQIEKVEVQNELTAWENQKEPEPSRSEAVIRNRQRLEAMNIPYQEFYKVIEFGQKLDETACSRLEEALLRMGILDAIIVDEEYKEQVLQWEKGCEDRYLFAGNKHAEKSLLDILELNEELNDIFSSQRLTKILGNIAYDTESEMTIQPDGTYRMGVLTGTVTGEYEPGFLGQKARERQRLAKIEDCKQRLCELEERIQQCEKEKQNLVERKNILAKEYENLPTDIDMREALLMLREQANELKLLKNEVEKIWGNGYIRISDFRNHNDIGLYFCNLLGEDISKDKKKKSSRLEYYPLHAKIYTSSKGLAKPTLLHIDDEELKEIVGNRKPCFEQGYSIRMCDTDHEVNRIGRITYNDKVNPYNE